jgi:flagellar hook-associated protein 2
MTTSTTNSLSATTTNSIDVASIVSQLMTVANQPKVALQNKITKDQAIISDLGSLKSKLSSLQTSLFNLENPVGYLTVSASSTNSSAVNASVTNGARNGRYSVGVIQTAEASSNPISYGAIADPAITPLNLTSFKVTIGSSTYDSEFDTTIGGITLPKLGSNPTLNQLSSWVNSLNLRLGLPVSSSIVQTSAGNYSLVVSGTKTGLVNSVTIPDGGTGSDSYPLDNANQISARDAIITVNGLQVQRSSNTISDVYDKNPITFTLGSAIVSNENPPSSGTPQANSLITVGQGADNSAANIQDFVTQYNAVISQYQSMVSNSNNSTSGTNGSFSNDPTMLSFIQDLKQKISSGFVAGDKRMVSLASIGIDMQTDGTLKFNPASLSNFSDSTYSSALNVLSSGIHLGGSVDQNNNYVSGSSFSDSLTNILKINGTINQSIQMEKTNIANKNSKLINLQSQLDLLQKSYTVQYSQLNTLLFNLSQTSSQLTSSLNAVTNINAGK